MRTSRFSALKLTPSHSIVHLSPIRPSTSTEKLRRILGIYRRSRSDQAQRNTLQSETFWTRPLQHCSCTCASDPSHWLTSLRNSQLSSSILYRRPRKQEKVQGETHNITRYYAWFLIFSILQILDTSLIASIFTLSAGLLLQSQQA